MYIIDALLNLVLTASSSQTFDLRFAACECIKAYFHNHTRIRHHFIRRAIDGHGAGEDETANVLTTLLAGPQSAQAGDPYRLWFACVIVFHLIFEDIEAKNLLMAVAEGDAESGEEVVTCIQAITGHLIAGLQLGTDHRVHVGYLMVLCGWLFEDAAAVNDFLGEGSSLQSLVQAASRPGEEQVIIRGLCAVLLGILYEFSTKDSPIPRRELQPVIVTRLGRERYLDAITYLRQHPLIRDFEVLTQGAGVALPDVYFDVTFVDFLKDNFSRLSRAVDRDPGLEIQQKDASIDRDLVDSVRGELEQKNQALQKAESDLLDLERQLNQEQANHRRTQESAASELSNLRRINKGLQDNYEADLASRETTHQAATSRLEEQSSIRIRVLEEQVQRVQKEAESRMKGALDDRDRVHQIELDSMQHKVDTLEGELRQARSTISELQSAKTQIEKSSEKARTEHDQTRAKLQDQVWAVKNAEEKAKKAEQAVKEKEDARASVQTELDEFLIILQDLEEKRTQDKVRRLSESVHIPTLTSL